MFDYLNEARILQTMEEQGVTYLQAYNFEKSRRAVQASLRRSRRNPY